MPVSEWERRLGGWSMRFMMRTIPWIFWPWIHATLATVFVGWSIVFACFGLYIDAVTLFATGMICGAAWLVAAMIQIKFGKFSDLPPRG